MLGKEGEGKVGYLGIWGRMKEIDEIGKEDGMEMRLFVGSWS